MKPSKYTTFHKGVKKIPPPHTQTVHPIGISYVLSPYLQVRVSDVTLVGSVENSGSNKENARGPPPSKGKGKGKGERARALTLFEPRFL